MAVDKTPMAVGWRIYGVGRDGVGHGLRGGGPNVPVLSSNGDAARIVSALA